MRRREHALGHWRHTGGRHRFALDLLTHRVWDYDQDAYVHRVLRGAAHAGGKEAEAPPPPRDGGEQWRPRGGGGGDREGRSGGEACSCGSEPQLEQLVSPDKRETMATEYSELLSGQLASQTAFFDEAITAVRIEAAAALSRLELRAAELRGERLAVDSRVEAAAARLAAAQAEAAAGAAFFATALDEARQARIESSQLLKAQEKHRSEHRAATAAAAAAAAEAAEVEAGLLQQCSDLEEHLRRAQQIAEAPEEVRRELAAGTIGTTDADPPARARRGRRR